jgi:primosomal replication protein N
LNRLLLSARIVERGALRHTPAGVPALDLELRHESELSEDRQVRKVALQMRAVAIGGGITAVVAALPLGAESGFAGFLAAARNGRGLVFHVTAVEPAPV